MASTSLALEFRVRRMVLALAPWVLLIPLPGCGFGVPLKEPVAVTQQTQRSASIRPGESTRDSVRAVFGEPWLQSRFWGFDLYRAIDTSTELGGLFITIWPIPLGIFTSQVDGYVLVAYDTEGRVEQVSTGDTSKFPGDQYPLMLRARDLSFGVEKNYQRGPQLMADANRLQDYLVLRRRSATCTLIVACEETGYQKWPYEACPNRVVVDNAESIDPTPFFACCDTGKDCPADFLQIGQVMQVPLIHPVNLPAGRHRLVMTSSTFKGTNETSFECAPGEVRFGIIRGHVDWDWWGPRTSMLNANLTFERDLPSQWKSYRMLLYRGDHWLAQPEPDRP